MTCCSDRQAIVAAPGSAPGGWTFAARCGAASRPLAARDHAAAAEHDAGSAKVLRRGGFVRLDAGRSWAEVSAARSERRFTGLTKSRVSEASSEVDRTARAYGGSGSGRAVGISDAYHALWR